MLLTIEQLTSPVTTMYAERPDFKIWRLWAADLVDNVLEYKEAMKKLKVKELKGMLLFAYATKKADLIDEVFDKCFVGFLPVSTFSYTMGDRERSMMAIIDNATEESWGKYLSDLVQSQDEALAEHEKQLAGMKNPKTIEDFTRRYRSDLGLDEPQWAEFDRLRTEDCKNTVDLTRTSVDLGEFEIDIIDTKHTKKGYDLFVVQFNDWMPRRLWLTVYDRAQEFGGWYSGYDKDGAITGLQFKDARAREMFVSSVLLGDEDPGYLEQHLADIEELRVLNTYDRLSRLADMHLERLEAKKNNLANAKTNTCRRARMYASQDERIRYETAQCETLKNIAAFIQANPDHILANVRYRTDVETLLSLPMDKIDLSAAVTYNMSKDTAYELARRAGDHEAKLAYTMIMKRWRETKEGEKVKLNSKIVELMMNKGADVWWLADKYTRIARIMRMGMVNLFQLRHALRTLQLLIVNPDDEPAEVANLLKLSSMNIAGFFPTPTPLIAAMAQELDLVDTDIVCDPQAGKGDILRFAADMGCVTYGNEINRTLAAMCEADGLNVAWGNSSDQATLFEDANVVMMNPPFESGQAVKLLGEALQSMDTVRLSAIMPASFTTENAEQMLEAMRPNDWHQYCVYVIANPDGAFKSSFRPTGVNTVMLVIT